MSVERGAVSQVSRTENSRRRRVRNVLVATGELVDDGLGRHSVQRLFAQVRRIRDRVAGLVDPFCAFDDFLDLDGTGHVVDDRWLIP